MTYCQQLFKLVIALGKIFQVTLANPMPFVAVFG